MPAWLIPILIKLVLPEVLQLLVKTGIISSVEASVAQGAINLEQALKNIKTYREYTQGYPATPTPNNIQPQKVQ